MGGVSWKLALRVLLRILTAHGGSGCCSIGFAEGQGRQSSSTKGRARALKARTLTDVYDARPQWLADAQAALDAAVAAAYGWECGYFGGGCAGGVAGVEFGGGRWVLRQRSSQLRAAFPKHLGGTEKHSLKLEIGAIFSIPQTKNGGGSVPHLME